MKKGRLNQIFSRKRVIILAILWVIINIAFRVGPWSTAALEEVSGTNKIPDIMLSYDLDSLRNLFATYGHEGIVIYKNIQLIDFIYPLIYGALLLGLLVRVGVHHNFKMVYGFPIVIVISDYCENFLLRHFVNIYPNLTSDDSALIGFSSFISSQKWSYIVLVLVNIIGFWIWNKIPKKSNS